MQPIKKLFVLAIAISTLCVMVPLTPQASAEIIVTNVIVPTFNFDLKLGSEGQDVLKLQRFLNADETTAVAYSGVGSRGKETTYFGQLTQNAVVKFQRKHSIKPVDGIVAYETRTKMNEMYPTTDFNKPYSKSYVETSSTGSTVSSNTNSSSQISLCQFIEVLIAIGAIAPEKATQARSIITSYGNSCVANMASTSTIPFNISSAYKNYPYSGTGLGSILSGTSSQSGGFDYSSLLTSLANNRNSYGGATNNYNYGSGGAVTSGLDSDSEFEGGKSLGKIRSYAVYAGGDLKNINVNSTSSATTSTTTIPAGSESRTEIIGDVSAKTEKDVPLTISGENTYDLGSNLKLSEAMNTAVGAVNKTPCTQNIASTNVDLGGKTLQPGVYCYSGDIKITGTLTLGEPGIYIFRTTKSLITYYSSSTATSTVTTTATTTLPKVASVKYSGENVGVDKVTGIPPYSLFWSVASSTKLASSTIFLGTIVSPAGKIELGEWADIPEGRILTGGPISLNKNFIAIPPDPLLLTVVLDGRSDGSVSDGAEFYCEKFNSDYPTGKIMSPTGTTTWKQMSDDEGNVVCQSYYSSGETVRLEADPLTEEAPLGNGEEMPAIFRRCSKDTEGKFLTCENHYKQCSKNDVNSCSLVMKEDEDIQVELNLDQFSGVIVDSSSYCLAELGSIYRIGGDLKTGGQFILRNKIGGMYGPVHGTLEDYNIEECWNTAGKYRVIEDIHFGR